MKSQTSLLNKTLFSHFNGTIFWLTVVFMAMNIIALPLSIWIVTFDREMVPGYEIPENFLFQMSAGQLIIGMIFSAFLAMFLLNYLNDEASSDFMHSLPVKRTSMLFHALLAGVLAIIVPLLITAGILFIERMIFIPEIEIMAILKWLVYAVFVHCVIFAIAIFAGFLVNGIFLHLQIILLILFLPLALWGMIYLTATILYDGIPSGFFAYSETVLNATFPYVAVIQLYDGISILTSAVWGILAIVLIVISFLLYKARRNENVTNSFNFKWLRALLVAVVTITGMLAAGVAVSTFIPSSAVISVVGFTFGSVISYLIIEMLFQRNARIQISWKSVLTTLVIIIVFWSVFLFSWHRFVNFVPAAEDVDSVYIPDQGADYELELIDTYFDEGYLFNDDNDAVEQAINVHEIALEEKGMPGVYTMGENAFLEINYKMKDGTVKTREFNTLNLESEAIRLSAKTHMSEYDIHSDMLANMKESDDYEISLDQYDVRNDSDLVKQYRENTGELKTYRPEVVNETGRVWINAYFNSDEYFSQAYLYGESSIYNQTIRDAVKADYFSYTDILEIDETSTMYTVELADEEVEQFFTDYKSLMISDLAEEYDMQEIHEDRDGTKDMIDHINSEGPAPESNKFLVYSYPEFMGPMIGTPAETDFSILAIQ